MGSNTARNILAKRFLFLLLFVGIGMIHAAGQNPFEFIKAGFFDILEKYVAVVILGVLWITILVGIGFGNLPWIPSLVIGGGVTAGLFLFPGLLSSIRDWAASYRPSTTVGN
ncbi:hypothetical protein [Helicobacter equorum]|uniref:Uncharacterized protein n=1 Tax=Helicobacter equorum TaxID=361872 RepID=A0A3D8IMI2_9HELI|nr:hypothetical protein [Helicobacter equorum]RDU66448.1 hypothetical protein CQA54_07040 [Helicobacter equorum]